MKLLKKEYRLLETDILILILILYFQQSINFSRKENLIFLYSMNIGPSYYYNGKI